MVDASSPFFFFLRKALEFISQRKLLVGNAHLLQKILQQTGLISCSKGPPEDAVLSQQGSLGAWKAELVQCISEVLPGKHAFVQAVVEYYLYLGCCCKQRDFPLDGPPHQSLNM